MRLLLPVPYFLVTFTVPERYLARYVFKSATGNRSVLLRSDGRVRWD